MKHLRLTRSAVVAVGVLLCCDIHAQTISEGVRMGVVYTGDVVANVAGGLDRGARYIDNLDLSVSFDGNVIGWTGGSAFLYGIGNQGGNISRLVGDAQVVNNIEASTNWRLFEAWIEQSVGSRLSLLVGLYDLNSEFDVNRAGALFMNSSHGTGLDLSQSGINGPSIFPVTSVGVRARLGLTRNLEIRGAVLDGIPGDPEKMRGTHISFNDGDGLLFAGELELSIPSSGHTEIGRAPGRMTNPSDTKARVVAGGWGYTRAFDRLDGGAGSGDSRGAYLLAEVRAFSERAPAQGLDAFVRVGVAEESVNRFGSYLGAGLVYTGLVAGRDRDQAGVALAVAVNGDAYLEATDLSPDEDTVTRTETNIEVTYLTEIAPWLSTQLDLQVVINPNTRSNIPTAVVPALRVIFAP